MLGIGSAVWAVISAPVPFGQALETLAGSEQESVKAELLPATDPAATVRADVSTLLTARQLSPNIIVR